MSPLRKINSIRSFQNLPFFFASQDLTDDFSLGVAESKTTTSISREVVFANIYHRILKYKVDCEGIAGDFFEK